MIPRPLLVPVLLLLAGCGVGGAGGGDPAVAAAADDTRGTWQVLDLASGAAQAAEAAPARSQALAFRRVRLAGWTGSASGAFARQDGEDGLAAVPVGSGFYIAACELTRAQWRLLAGSTPWVGLPGADAAGGEDLPALGLSFTQVGAALAAWNAAHGPHLRLPSPAEWEVAARAGGAASFPWGEERRGAVAGRYAVTADTDTAPQVVGSRLPNALGLFDLCGNAWEWDAAGDLRGGSWGDPLSLARPAARAGLLPDSQHAAVGVRLVYLP